MDEDEDEDEEEEEEVSALQVWPVWSTLVISSSVPPNNS